MTRLQVYEAGTGRLVDTITITEAGEVLYTTDAGRPLLEALTGQYDRRGNRLSVDQVAEALDGWTDGALELFAPDYLDPIVPNMLADLREAAGTGVDLEKYWVAGKGAAKIRWDSVGDFDRCVRHLGKFVSDPKGLCATYHKKATGTWPGKGKGHR